MFLNYTQYIFSCSSLKQIYKICSSSSLKHVAEKEPETSCGCSTLMLVLVLDIYKMQKMSKNVT